MEPRLLDNTASQSEKLQRTCPLLILLHDARRYFLWSSPSSFIRRRFHMLSPACPILAPSLAHRSRTLVAGDGRTYTAFHLIMRQFRASLHFLSGPRQTY